MKGQYLAIETTLTFGMGIAVAIGSIAVFSNYSNNIENSAVSQEAKIVKSRIQSALFTLKGVDSGWKTVKLPEDLGSTDYRVVLDKNIRIITDDRTYSESFPALGTGYELSGTADGGTVNIYKNGDNFTLREG
ncbi:MAG: hypothetical protein ABEJ98_05365 [Candidatus Nanohaloarchaea archaeon]